MNGTDGEPGGDGAHDASPPAPDHVDDQTPIGGPLSFGKRLVYRRADSGLEFNRAANFSDAVYAIALTLIAVELRPPVNVSPQGDGRALLEALNDMSGEIVIFFIAFWVMGSYWVANHKFVAGLRAIDSSMVWTLLPYLAFVAFLPFPASLMAAYEGNPVAYSTFAFTMATVSFFEWVLLKLAHDRDLYVRPLSKEGYRYASVGSLLPVLWFLLSIPVMFVSTGLGIALWFIGPVVGIAFTKKNKARW
ncbi:MAG: DUF1211 domain-containing protein [Actinobacteria bacterium]|nr:DUF1211 domain-containing protein [Actinomycetota bacterium]